MTSSSPPQLLLAGKRIVITGAASGFGRATAIMAVRHGARVVCADWNEEGVLETVRMINDDAVAVAVRADVSSEADNEAMVARCVHEWGGIDGFFANAGVVGTMATIHDTDADEFMRTFRINALGVFLGIKAASRAMLKAGGGGGSIVATASVAGLRSGAGPVDYSASKAAVINMCQTSANELAGSGIRVNAVLPGLVPTGMTRPMFEMARARGTDHKIGQLNPLKRAGTADEVASLAIFFLSDMSTYVNGQALPVCGGLSSSHPIVPSAQGRSSKL